MSNAIDLVANLERRLDHLRKENHKLLKGGDGGGTFDPMEARVIALEATTKRIEDKLDKVLDKTGKIEIDIARLDGKVSALPNAESFGHLRGRVDSLPTIPKIAGLFAIIGVLISIASNWEKVSTFIR